jgi:hypothetical protein
MDNNVKDLLKEIKTVDDNVSGIIVPMLKDSIGDYKKIIDKLIAIIIVLIIGLVGVIGYTSYLIYSQNAKYNEFLSQFEFESDETIYQDTDNNSIINSGINFNN